MTVALERYSRQQVKEDHAAAYLSENAFPSAKWLVPFFLSGNVLSSVVAKTFPDLLPPSIQSLCSETLTPYSEVILLIKILFRLTRDFFGFIHDSSLWFKVANRPFCRFLQIVQRHKAWLSLVELTSKKGSES